ncbi:MAG: D-aminoacyl-tRNA deacylase [candidate division Zixibacteria bacterium]|nr:D-aminoacyl-tRNA deacylase [candidate division Zixibacteria bacterium]
MRAVIQRVNQARVSVEEKIIAQIGKGLLILVGATQGDGEKDIKYLADRCINLRIFEDQEGKMNLSALDVGAELLVVSQFTLYADVKKGRRPSFTEALEPDLAQKLYLKFIHILEQSGLKVEQGEFGAKMVSELINWGPVTLILDSR